jgi:hypothetical protein
LFLLLGTSNRARVKQIVPLYAVMVSGQRHLPGSILTTPMERTMLLLLIISVPVCIELAAWVVDATFVTQLLNRRQ